MIKPNKNNLIIIITMLIMVPSTIRAQGLNPPLTMNGYWWLDNDGTSIEAEDNTGYGPEDVPMNTNISGVNKNSPIAIRAQIEGAPGQINNDAEDLQLQYRLGSSTCTANSGWTTITTLQSNDWVLQTDSSGQTIDPQRSENRISDTGQGTPGVPSEWEWIISATEAADDEQTYTFRVINNGEALDNYDLESCPQAITAEPIPASFSQTDYRWYVDSGLSDVNDPWSPVNQVDLAENTAIAYPPNHNDPPGTEQEIRLRVNLTINSNDLQAGGSNFKLQYKKGTDASCTSGAWTDVNENNEWEFTSSEAVDDKAPITKVLTNTAAGKSDKYVKSNPVINSVSALVGDLIEYDFHIVGTNISSNTQYSFRVVETDAQGSEVIEFDSYANCPTLITEPQATDFMRHGKLKTETGQTGGMFWAD